MFDFFGVGIERKSNCDGRRFGELFELKCDLPLYDVTSTYFEGDMEGCPIAKRG
ncbi:MAG: hypothetical protein ABI614_25075 [Planctomycetota bacterium]